MRLMREVRFFCDGDDRGPREAGGGNTWAGTSTRAPVLPFWTIRAVLEGPVDLRSGYLCEDRKSVV